MSTKVKHLRVPISQNTTGRELFYKVRQAHAIREVQDKGVYSLTLFIVNRREGLETH